VLHETFAEMSPTSLGENGTLRLEGHASFKTVFGAPILKKEKKKNNNN
jgi:hypothetical protein